MEKLTVGSLFSGIGGIDLGLQRAGFEIKWQCEIDEYCRRVLAKHWPDVPKHKDITKLSGDELAPVDMIAGGFPCQDISVAGKRGGIHAKRSGLFFELMRIVRVVRPRLLLLENVSGLLSRTEWMGAVLGELSESGYDAEWDCIPAAAVGAPHRRDRIFIVAHARHTESQRWDGETEIGEGEAFGKSSSCDYDVGNTQCGGRSGNNRRRAISESTRRCAEVADTTVHGRHARRSSHASEGATGREFDRSGEQGNVADAYKSGPQERTAQQRDVGKKQPALKRSSSEDAHANSQSTFGTSISWSECSQWTTEPDVGRVAHGVPSRVDRLKGLGNAVVPQVAEWIGNQMIVKLF